jgi:DNA repair protein RadC
MQLNENLFKDQVAEVELVYRSKVDPSDRIKVLNSDHFAKLFRSIWNPDNMELLEEAKVIYLNKGNRVLGAFALSKGGLSNTVVDVKLVILAGLRLHCSFICLCHNHPSGNVKPSKNDEYLTEQIRIAASFFNIKLLDHIILTKDGYFSMSDEGVL